MALSNLDRALLAGTVALGLAFAASHAHAYDAVVSYCHDGDTCRLENGTIVRLHGVDSPEIAQPFGLQAQAMINRLIAGQHVDIQDTGQRSHNRVVADIYLNGHSVGAEMVTAGLAWVEGRWNTDPYMPSRQQAAQQAHRGLWADPAAIPPWQWRAEHGVGGYGFRPSNGPHWPTWRTR